jgi:hypothetical protein
MGLESILQVVKGQTFGHAYAPLSPSVLPIDGLPAKHLLQDAHLVLPFYPSIHQGTLSARVEYTTTWTDHLSAGGPVIHFDRIALFINTTISPSRLSPACVSSRSFDWRANTISDHSDYHTISVNTQTSAPKMKTLVKNREYLLFR